MYPPNHHHPRSTFSTPAVMGRIFWELEQAQMFHSSSFPCGFSVYRPATRKKNPLYPHRLTSRLSFSFFICSTYLSFPFPWLSSGGDRTLDDSKLSFLGSFSVLIFLSLQPREKQGARQFWDGRRCFDLSSTAN